MELYIYEEEREGKGIGNRDENSIHSNVLDLYTIHYSREHNVFAS